MSDFNDALHVDTVPDRTPGRDDHPKGWEPGIAWDGTTGSITTKPLEQPPDPVLWAELVADWGLDPNVTTIEPGSVQVRGWDANVGGGVIKRLRYYRATLKARADLADRADVEALCRQVAKRKKRNNATTVADVALIVALADWQIGKGEADGSAGSVDRILTCLDRLVAHIKQLKRSGRLPAVVYLCGLGDLVEQCDGHYPMQAFQTDLDRREQVRVVRRLILRYIDEVAALVPRVVCVAVPGNHGENRKDGKAFTTFTDNDDLAVFEQVAEILAANPDRYGHVSVMLADGLSTSFDACGVVIGLAHMHQGRSGGSTPQLKVEKWWAGHALGRGQVQDADILITGHYHHLMVSESTGRTWFQVPALDPGSAWFTEATGQHSPPGLFTVLVGDFGARKWDDMKVL